MASLLLSRLAAARAGAAHVIVGHAARSAAAAATTPSAACSMRLHTSVVRLDVANAASGAKSPTTGGVQVDPRALTPDHLARIEKKDMELRAAYDALAQQFHPHSQPAGGAAVTHQQALVKRMLYRSKQRGWLEVDLLLGTWASKHLSELSEAELVEFERILNSETLELYNVLTLRDPPPEHLRGPVMDRILAFIGKSPLGSPASPASYAEVKKGMSN